jgi:hypothetical protein
MPPIIVYSSRNYIMTLMLTNLLIMGKVCKRYSLIRYIVYKYMSCEKSGMQSIYTRASLSRLALRYSMRRKVIGDRCSINIHISTSKKPIVAFCKKVLNPRHASVQDLFTECDDRHFLAELIRSM